jgi:hypothetical protein
MKGFCEICHTVIAFKLHFSHEQLTISHRV